MEKQLTRFLSPNLIHLVCEYSRIKYDFSELSFVTHWIKDEHFKEPVTITYGFVNTRELEGQGHESHFDGFYLVANWPKNCRPKKCRKFGHPFGAKKLRRFLKI